jgi:Major Facilitator Superfamily
MKWIESWYISYALLGAAAAGILPILLPIVVADTSVASQVGLVMAAFSFGGLTAPLWGRLADGRRLHKALLAGGLACTALASAAFPFVSAPAVRAALALLQGIGIAAANTTANLFVVEAHPRSQWDARIGWLQTFYGGGQVVGLLVAGLVAQASAGSGLLLAGGLAAVAIVPGLLGAPRLPAGAVDRRPSLTHAARHAEWPTASPQRLYHHPTSRALRLLGSLGGGSFGLFLLGWFLSFGGSAAFFSLYPIVMRQSYGVGPALSSAGFAVSAALGLLLYAPAGQWSTRGKPLGVLRAGLAVRVAAYALLSLLIFLRGPSRGWPALGTFLIVVLAWSALSVASTALVAEMFSRRRNEGEGLGLFNAVTALAGVAGAAAGGWAAGALGYGAIPFVALGGTVAGLVVLLAGRFKAMR